MSAEQGDVETIREALAAKSQSVLAREEQFAALDRLAAALERAEQDAHKYAREAGGYLHDLLNAQTERDIARDAVAWEDMRAYNIRLEERVREAELALAEIAQLGQPISGLETAWTCAEIARAALRPFEDTSDES